MVRKSALEKINIKWLKKIFLAFLFTAIANFIKKRKQLIWSNVSNY